jgi:hypothetical protein
MIDTDEVGTLKLKELVDARYKHPKDFNGWEFDFIGNMRGAEYSWLTNNQKTAIGRVYDNVVLRK